MRYFILIFALLISEISFGQTDRAGSVTFTRGTAGLEVKEISTVQCRADVGGNLGGKYFVIYSALNAVKYAVWYNTGSSTAPTVTGATLVEVTITTADTGTTVCTNTKTSLDAITVVPFVTTRLTDTLTITNSDYGVTTDIADGNSTHTQIVKATDGVNAVAAIAGGSIIGNLRGFQVCNDAVNTSTYMIIGWASTVNPLGRRIAPGDCFVCDECKVSILSNMKVAAQAAANGYSVVQFKK
jgi:hypothetical protein